MIYYNAYVQFTPRDILIIVTNEKNKNQTVVVDSFQMDIRDYINDNGLIQFPLVLAEDVAKKINNDKYSVKDITLIFSPKDSTVLTSQENAILDSKELVEFIKNKTEKTFKKHPEAYEMAWVHTGNVLDDGAPYSAFLQYCYPVREINKLKKAFAKNKIHVVSVLLPELATAALFSQYFDEFNDPTTLIVESGFVSSPNSITTTYWYKRNILENIGNHKVGFASIVKEIGSVYTQLHPHDIETLIFSCGIFKDYPTDDASEIFSLNDINPEEWFAVATRAFHVFATAFRNDIQRRAEKPDVIILAGPIACIPSIKEYLYHNYSLIVDIWENKFDLKIDNTTILYTNSMLHSPLFATVTGAMYYQHWVKGLKKGTLSKPILEIDINKHRKHLIICLVAALLYACYLFVPGWITLKTLEAESKRLTADAQTAQSIKTNIAKYENNIALQQQFLDKTKTASFNIREFMFGSILLKPEGITIISVDTPNYLEEVIDTRPYYYIRKAVERKSQNTSDEGNNTVSFQHNALASSNQDWTFGLDWTGISLTTQNIEQYLIENNQLNIAPYLITEVVIRGYGSKEEIASFAQDLGSMDGVYNVGMVTAEKTIPTSGGVSVETNVFEFYVLFGGGSNNVKNTENSN